MGASVTRTSGLGRVACLLRTALVAALPVQPCRKLNLGLGLYGNTWTLSTNQTGLGAPTSGPGPAQLCTGERQGLLQLC